MVLNMLDFGDNLCTRASGRAVYESVVKTIQASGETLVFDFDGVSVVTNSFADEVFGRLAMEFGLEKLIKATTFRNVSDFPAKVISYAVQDAEKKRATFA